MGESGVEERKFAENLIEVVKEVLGKPDEWRCVSSDAGRQRTLTLTAVTEQSSTPLTLAQTEQRHWPFTAQVGDSYMNLHPGRRNGYL